MKRVLVVSPSFPPVSAADLHRVRTSLPFYAEFGWQPHVLAIRPDAHGGLLEPGLTETVPRDIAVTRTGALPAALTAPIGVGNVALRALPHLFTAGSTVIRDEGADLVFFSTTMFPALVLGRLWKLRFGTPYVIDMQDPWKSDYQGAGVQRGLKARLARGMHAVLEPFAMRRVDGIVSVSPAYSRTLSHRYPWIHDDMCTTIPFGASAGDIDAARRMSWRNEIFDPHDGQVHGVAVGRGGADMAIAAEILFRAMKARAGRGSMPDVRLSFVGTDYASRADHRTMAPVADAVGLGGVVNEQPARVPYLAGLRLLSDAHFTIVLGSDDPSYSPSKIYPYLLTGRPFVAVLHEASPVAALLRDSGMGVVVTFSGGQDATAAIDALASQLDWVFQRRDQALSPPAELLESVSAREGTRRQCAAFEAALRHASPQGVPCVE